MPRPPFRLVRVERLEDRCTPAVWNNPWADPGQLTLSFAPDGTQITDASSSLHQDMNGSMPEAVWKSEILRAFQTWAVHANINLSVVSDNGKPFGEDGPIQGSSWHGDIRVGGRPLSPQELAVSTPFDLFGGWSGDVLLNSNYSFNQGGAGGAHDLYTVALQEAGHVFGLDNSPDPNSAMFTQYQGPRAGLDASDIAALQAIYGPRQSDQFDVVRSNGTLATASILRFVSDADQLQATDGTAVGAPFVAAGDLTTAADVDVYRVQVPGGASDFFVALRTKGLSLLTAKVTVTDSTGKVVATATATDPSDGDLSLFVSGARAGATYYVQVQGATKDVFGIGAYRLAVGKEAAEAVAGPAAVAFQNDDGHKNDTLNQATHLGTVKDSTDLRWDFTYRGSIRDDKDADWYRIETKETSSGTLVVTVWATEVGKLDPIVTVFDEAGKPVPAEVLANDAGFYTLQVRNVMSGSKYYVKVAATDPQSSYKEGNYFLGIDFRAEAISLYRFAAAALTQSNPEAATTLTTHETQLYHFVLSATSTDPTVKSAVRMVIVDAQGRTVFTLFAEAGRSASGDVMLAPGTYSVRFTASAEDTSQSLPTVNVVLTGDVRSDPIGPTAVNTSTTAAGSTTTKPPSVWGGTTTFSGPYSSPYTPL